MTCSYGAAILTTFCRETLRRLLSSQSYSDALHAAEVLSYTHDPIAIPYLEKGFATPYPIQALLVRGLERIGTDDSIRALLEEARSNPRAAADEIRRALAKLATQTSDQDLQRQIAVVLQGGT